MKKNLRIAAFFFIVCFLPFLRSCGDVSMGFPAAALTGRHVFAIDKLNGLSLLINLPVMVLLVAAAIIVLKRWSPGRVGSAGISGIIIYHILIITGYFVTYPLYAVFTNRFMEYVAGIHLYALYPLHEVLEFASLDRVSEGMKIYGDIYDIKFRLHYLLMTVFWFGAGCLVGYIKARKESKV